jgi:hypothetical protein
MRSSRKSFEDKTGNETVWCREVVGVLSVKKIQLVHESQRTVLDPTNKPREWQFLYQKFG